MQPFLFKKGFRRDKSIPSRGLEVLLCSSLAEGRSQSIHTPKLLTQPPPTKSLVPYYYSFLYLSYLAVALSFHNIFRLCVHRIRNPNKYYIFESHHSIMAKSIPVEDALSAISLHGVSGLHITNDEVNYLTLFFHPHAIAFGQIKIVRTINRNKTLILYIFIKMRSFIDKFMFIRPFSIF